MTLVYREEKKDVFEPNKNQLGPGYYNTKGESSHSGCQAAFNSAI
jgi:hypothetical protein